MNIEIETLNIETVEVVNTRTGTTVFNTDDYTELKGKTGDEIKQMDVTTLLNLKTNEGTRLVETMDYRRWEDSFDWGTDCEYEGGEHINEITDYGITIRG